MNKERKKRGGDKEHRRKETRRRASLRDVGDRRMIEKSSSVSS